MKYIKHERFGFVPVIEVSGTHITWDGGQFDRSVPPNKIYNEDPIEDFDLNAEFVPPSLDQEFSTNLPEHEILLSFHEDRHCEMFGYWWQQEGLNKFGEYLLDNPEDFRFENYINRL